MDRMNPQAQVALDDLLLRLTQYSWAYRNLIGQDKEHSPRRPIQTISSSANVNPLSQVIVVSATATATLESATAGDARWHLFINTGSGTMTVSGFVGSTSVATSTQYACIYAWCDGTNWYPFRTDLATALGTLPVANGGTGATTAAGARTNLGLDNLTQPQMLYGGVNFNGTTTYYDGNALTGIADGKSFTFFCIARFANAASATERLIHSTGTRFTVLRTSTGAIQVVASDTTPTTVLDIQTATNVCSAAGTYSILISVDLATGGSSKMYVNDASQTVTVTTFSNTNIDFTTTENSIGGSVGGANLFTGDIYLVYLDATTNQNLDNEAVRRKFLGVGNVSRYLGANGELARQNQTRPVLFLAYDDSNSWDINRGSSTDTFTRNGAIANATTSYQGQFAPLDDYTIPITVTADYTVGRTDGTIINNRAATNTLTLLNAAQNKGRQLHVVTIQAQAVNSASSNVVPITGGAAGTAILAASGGAWALLEATPDGNWTIIAS